MALKYHPDRNQEDPQAEEMFKEASEAYSVLGNEEKRRIYDQFGFEGLKNTGRGFSDFSSFFSDSIFSDFEDILGSFFGFGSSRGGGGGGRGRNRGVISGKRSSLPWKKLTTASKRRWQLPKKKIALYATAPVTNPAIRRKLVPNAAVAAASAETRDSFPLPLPVMCATGRAKSSATPARSVAVRAGSWIEKL